MEHNGATGWWRCRVWAWKSLICSYFSMSARLTLYDSVWLCMTYHDFAVVIWRDVLGNQCQPLQENYEKWQWRSHYGRSLCRLWLYGFWLYGLSWFIALRCINVYHGVSLYMLSYDIICYHDLSWAIALRAIALQAADSRSIQAQKPYKTINNLPFISGSTIIKNHTAQRVSDVMSTLNILSHLITVM